MSAPLEAGARLTSLLTEKQRLLQAFLELTEAQTPLIEAEDVEALTANLSQREQVIKSVNSLQPELKSLLREYGQKKFAAHSPTIDDLQQQISRILVKITEIDNKNRAAAAKLMDFFQGESRRANETRKGVGTYMKGAAIFAAEFVDERQ